MRAITDADLMRQMTKVIKGAEKRARRKLVQRGWATGMEGIGDLPEDTYQMIADESLYQELQGAPYDLVTMPTPADLQGLWSKVKKGFKKIGKKIKKGAKKVWKGVKKVAKVALPAVGMVFGGPVGAAAGAASSAMEQGQAGRMIERAPQVVGRATQVISGSGMYLPGNPQQAVLSPQVTQLAQQFAHRMLASRGMHMQSPDAQALLQMAVLQRQQAAARATPPYPPMPPYQPQPTPTSVNEAAAKASTVDTLVKNLPLIAAVSIPVLFMAMRPS